MCYCVLASSWKKRHTFASGDKQGRLTVPQDLFGSLLQAYSRNPSKADALVRYAMLGFALTEAVGLLALMMAFLILFG